MNNIDLGLIFFALAVVGMVLKSTYLALPLSEIKSRAEDQDKNALRLYKVATYTTSLQILMWVFIVLTLATSFVLFARSMPLGLSLLIIAILIYFIFSFIPARPQSKFNRFITKLFSPILSWLLYYMHPALNITNTKLKKHVSPSYHTGLYRKEDLIKLLSRQKSQKDSRLKTQDLDIAIRALNFPDKKVSDIFTPKKKIKSFGPKDVVGPILIDEIHVSGQAQAIVQDPKTKQIVGILHFSDLGIKSSGQVEDVMDKSIEYIKEDDTLDNALAAIGHNKGILVVIDDSEEYIGSISSQNIVSELIGTKSDT